MAFPVNVFPKAQGHHLEEGWERHSSAPRCSTTPGTWGSTPFNKVGQGRGVVLACSICGENEEFWGKLKLQRFYH